MSNKEIIIKGCENWVNNHKDENFLLTYSSVVELLTLLKKQQDEIEKLEEKVKKYELEKSWEESPDRMNGSVRWS